MVRLRVGSVEHILSAEAIEEDDDKLGQAVTNMPVPVANQIRTYWWCSPPRTGRQRMRPARSTARETGASFSKEMPAYLIIICQVRQQYVTEVLHRHGQRLQP